jgi:hypothetical protein
MDVPGMDIKTPEGGKWSRADFIAAVRKDLKVPVLAAVQTDP